MKPKSTITLQLLHRMWTIQLPFIFIAIFHPNVVYCYDSESLEANRLEVTPFYDTVIYSDIADIINDFESNANAQYDAFTNSESESEENIEDLLSEYQHYLDKAHKQRINYMEKKTKNKVPPLRREKYSKTKVTPDPKYNDFYYANNYYNPGTFKFSQTSFNNPLDMFIPLNSKGKLINKFELSTTTPKAIHEDIVPLEKIIFNDKKILKMPPTMHKPPFDSIKSSCFCKNGQIPCDCNCKQCIMPFESMARNHMEQMKLHSIDDEKSNMPNSILYDNFGKEHYIDDFGRDLSENTLNIRIKVDLQLPKAQESIGKYFKFHNRDKTLERDDIFNSKEVSSPINVPLPYFNFPIPMDVFGYKKTVKYSKHDNAPIHKITIHKKKKTKVNNNNKKHRKKVITFHNIKLEPQQVFPTHYAENKSDFHKQENLNNTMLHNNSEPNVTHTEPLPTVNKTDEVVNETHADENIYVTVNISSTNDNVTDDIHKLENSIETDYTKTISNETTKLPISMREKRAVFNETNGNKSLNQQTDIKSETTATPQDKSNITKEKNNPKKTEKGILSDTELLYWPDIVKNQTYTHTKNITTIILENEHKKSKLNMSKETIRHNHTRALEQAIFGEVDWDNIDAVAPAFMSFVGKYIRGVLTFCSQSVCHSMKCASKTCIHRVCLPADRLNNKGHCTGTNKTDSVASMESIMDLPSNIAFEIVDILQNKLLGKVFGKATLCINSKCITFVASKKNFIKSRCSVKELNTIGHCSNTKNVKIICPTLKDLSHTKPVRMKLSPEIRKKANLITKWFTIYFAILSATSYPIGEHLYLNPWSKINKANPKIIEFGADGTYTVKPVNEFINLKSTIQALISRQQSVTNYSDVLEAMRTDIISTYKDLNVNKTKIKILIRCNKTNTICRFLACPNIKSHCTLCEANLNEPYNNVTTCEHFETKFLSK